MKFFTKLPVALLVLIIFSTSTSFACSSDCCNLSGITKPVSAVSLMSDAVHYAQAGIVISTHAGCAVIQETQNQVAAIPETLNISVQLAEDATASLFESSLNLLRSATVAVINLSTLLLRIVFSSFSALASVILPF